ncbi:MAG: hypothetical protein Q4C22_07815, partial [Bacillota bacterium]|nr:hypothetical protein [Bacillota bacterium]
MDNLFPKMEGAPKSRWDINDFRGVSFPQLPWDKIEYNFVTAVEKGRKEEKTGTFPLLKFVRSIANIGLHNTLLSFRKGRACSQRLLFQGGRQGGGLPVCPRPREFYGSTHR